MLGFNAQKIFMVSSVPTTLLKASKLLDLGVKNVNPSLNFLQLINLLLFFTLAVDFFFEMNSTTIDGVLAPACACGP